jgi:hypothetical protein
MIRGLILILGSLVTTPGFADVSVRFIEDYPTDRFEFVQRDTCATGPVAFVVELAGAEAGLLFDTAENGAGFERAAPFTALENARRLVGTPVIEDGSTTLAVVLHDFAPGERFSFSIDLDDTRTDSFQGQTQVSEAEMTGVMVSAFLANGEERAAWFADARSTTIDIDFCR